MEGGGGVSPEVTVEVGGNWKGRGVSPEVTVEVGGRLAEPVLLMLLQGILHVRGEEAPDGGGGQLR